MTHDRHRPGWYGGGHGSEGALRTPEDDKDTFVDDDAASTFTLHDGAADVVDTVENVVDGASETTEELAADRYGPPEPLGSGGLGEVYLVQDRVLGRAVAKKVLREGVSAASRARFSRESKVTAQLEHPSIVPVYDAGFDAEGRRFYTMKHVRGRALSDCIAASDGLYERLKWIEPFCDACDAIAYAHSREVVHRDLKPDNVMVGEFGECLVLDWGLARHFDEPDEEDSVQTERPVELQDSFRTRAGAIGGTPAYMSPEQALGRPLGAAADIFGLGAILYEILTGVAPYAHAESVEQALLLAGNGAWRPVKRVVKGVPAELIAIVQRALDPEPTRRYRTASELGDDLRRWLRGQSVSAYRYSPLEVATRFASRHSTPIMAMGGGLVIAVAVAAIGLASTLASVTAGVRSTNRALAEARLQLAQQALRDDELTKAYDLAVSVLELREDPGARGILAAIHGTSIPRRSHLSDRPCGRILVTTEGVLCTQGESLSLLDPDSWEPRWTQPAGRRLIRAEHDRVVTFGDDIAIEVFDLRTGEQLGRYPQRLNAFFEPDGTLRTYSRQEGERHLAEGPEPVPTVGSLPVAWWPIEGGGLLLTASGTGISVVGGATEAVDLRSHAPVTGTLRTDDGVWVFGSRLERFDPTLTTSLEQREPNGRLARLTAVGDWLVGVKTDRRLRLWDPLGVPQEIEAFALLGDAAALGPDRMLSSGESGLDAWTLGSGRPWTLPAWGGARMLDVSPDHRFLITCDTTQPTRVLELPSMRLVWEHPLKTSVCGWTDVDEAVAVPLQGQVTLSSGVRWTPRGTGEIKVVEGVPAKEMLQGQLTYYGPGGSGVVSVDGSHRLETQGLTPLVFPHFFSRGDEIVDLRGNVVERSAEPHLFLGEAWKLVQGPFSTELRRRTGGGKVCDLGRLDIAAENSRYLFGATWDGTILAFAKDSLERGRCQPRARMTGHRDKISKLTAGEDFLISRSWDQELRQWSLEALSISPAEARRWLEEG